MAERASVIKHERLLPIDDVITLEGSLRVMFIGDIHLCHAAPSSRRDDYASVMLGKIDNLRKIAKKMQVDIAITSGDLFHTKTQPAMYVVECIHRFKKWQDDNIPFYTVVGNHDIMYANTNTLDKVPLGLLFSSGTMKRLGTITVRLENKTVFFRACDYAMKPHIPDKVSEQGQGWVKFLCGHNFIPPQPYYISPDECYTEEELKSCDYDAFLMGHDHMVFPDVDYHGKKLIRPGALSRGSKHVTNRARPVCFSIIDVDKTTGEIKSTLMELPVSDASEIFSETTIAREDVSSQMSAFVKSLTKTETKETDQVDEILKKLCGDDQELYNHTKGYLDTHGIT